MIGVVVVTHGQLAAELVNAAETIVGDLPRFAAVSIGWHDTVELARDEIAQAVARVDAGHGVIVLTDMFGGTPSNLAITFLADGRIEVITGVNLPMLLKLAGAREVDRPPRARAANPRGWPQRASGWPPTCCTAATGRG